jgi:signal transduction histidine kinase
VVYVQVGRETVELENRLAREQIQQQKEIKRIQKETQAATSRLRSRLALIGLSMFVALPVGGWLLIGRGLQPLRRLTDAVSQVSERDFRLPVEPDQLSYELLPIHARLSDTLKDLKRAFEREKQSVADISHELRTPVAGMLATLDVTLRKPRDAEQYRAALEETRVIGRQLAGLVERVMMLATLDAGADRLAITEFDLSEIAKGCATVIRPIAIANHLTFEADIPYPLRIRSDPNKVREVLINLLHNSVEYNRPGGTIRLSVRPSSRGTVQVEVADTGIGMTPEVKSRIFERFYRADASRHAAGAHAGLGLSIVKEYVRQLQGQIHVDSEVGVGSTFRLTLPIVIHDDASSPQAKSAGHTTDPESRIAHHDHVESSEQRSVTAKAPQAGRLPA